MFFKSKINLSYNNDNYEHYLNLNNIDYISGVEIKKIESEIKNYDSWNHHKLKVIRIWINKNFKLSESFISRFEKILKKLRIRLSAKEERFLFNIKSLYFATWRPLKEIIVKFQLDKKEVVYFYEKDANIYVEDKEKQFSLQSSGDLFFSNKNIYICTKNQKILKKYNFDNITNVNIDSLGVIVKIDNKNYLFRSHVKFMTYVILQRVLPRLNLDIDSVNNLYDYFDFWNKLIKKIV